MLPSPPPPWHLALSPRIIPTVKAAREVGCRCSPHPSSLWAGLPSAPVHTRVVFLLKEPEVHDMASGAAGASLPSMLGVWTRTTGVFVKARAEYVADHASTHPVKFDETLERWRAQGVALLHVAMTSTSDQDFEEHRTLWDGAALHLIDQVLQRRPRAKDAFADDVFGVEGSLIGLEAPPACVLVTMGYAAAQEIERETGLSDERAAAVRFTVASALACGDDFPPTAKGHKDTKPALTGNTLHAINEALQGMGVEPIQW